MSGSGLPPLFKTVPKTGVPTGNIGMTMPTTSRLDQALLQKGSYGDAGKLSQMFSPEQLKMIPRLPTAGLLNNQSSSYFTPPKMPQAPKTGLLDNFGSNLMNNNLFMLGAALSDRSKPFAQNFANFQNNMLQRQMMGRQLQQQDFTNRLALADLGIKQATAGIPKYKSVQYFQSPDGKTTLSGFLTDRGLVDQSGNRLDIPAGYKPFNQPSQMLNVNMPPPQQEAARRLMIEEKVFVPQITNFQNQAMQSRNYATTSQNLVDIGRGLEGGTINEIKREIKKLLPEFDFTGIEDLENAKAQAFEAYLQKSIPAQRVAGSGSTSDIEFKGFKASLPNLLLTQTGREAVAEAANIFARRDAKVADYAANLLAEGKYTITAVNQYADKIAKEMPLPDKYFREQEDFLAGQGF